MKLNASPFRHFSLPLLLVVCLSLFIFNGCYYYKVNTKTGLTPADLRWADFNKKYLILHQGNLAWHLNKPVITDDSVSGSVFALPGSRLQYQTTNSNGINRYKRKFRDVILDQAHLYVRDSLSPDFITGHNTALSFSTINKMEVYQKAKGATTASWVIPLTVGSLATAVALVGVIAALTSCPLVYVMNDRELTFTGEIFGGAVYSSLERHDYLPLPAIKPSGNRYTLKIANKLEEVQHINLAELWIVNHPEDVMVLADRSGAVHSVSYLRQPLEAFSTAKRDLLPLVSNKDSHCFLFDEEPSLTSDTNAFNSVVMTFPAPGSSDTGKLVIKAGNSLWGDYTYGEFIKLFGNKYDRWIKSQKRVPAEKNTQWKLDQRFVLLVYLETDNGWEFVDYFDLIGSLGEREMIMPVALDKAHFSKNSLNDRVIRIKLVSGFKFWELDYAAMDFSENSPVTVDCIQPIEATTESGKDVGQLISKNDNDYYVQKNTGDEGLVVYLDTPAIPGMKKTVFLHARGYYKHVRDYQGPPDITQLLTFGNPGRLSKFSFTNFQEFTKAKAVLVTDPVLP
jgi:hypothetical protein